MSLFVGRHLNKIDKKGRASVPKHFRSVIQGRGFQGLYVFPSFTDAALEACSEDFLLKITGGLAEFDLFSEEYDDMSSIILESAHFLSFDTEGRIVLPQELLDHASITDDALFVGRGDQFRIWEPKAHSANRSIAFERARARGMTVKLKRNDSDEGSRNK